MTKQKIQNAASTFERELVHSRLIDAPRKRLFRAFAQREHLATWWGPDGFSSTFAKEAGQTRVGWRQVFATAQEKEAIAQSVIPANGQDLARLQIEVQNVR